jgi:hypothetical protein
MGFTASVRALQAHRQHSVSGMQHAELRVEGLLADPPSQKNAKTSHAIRALMHAIRVLQRVLGQCTEKEMTHVQTGAS